MRMACYAIGGNDGVDPAHPYTPAGHAPERVNRRKREEQDAHQGALKVKHFNVDLCTLLAEGREKLH